jgi:hypothetical protein
MPLRIRVPSLGTPSTPLTTKTWIKVAGVWKEAITWIKVSGVWKQTTPYIKVGGVWK